MISNHFQRLGTERTTRIVMKTQLILIGAVSLLGISFVSTSYAENTSEYLHFTRHRDSNGNLLMGPTQHQAEPSIMQKTMVPSQPKTFEQRTTDWGMSPQEVKENEPVQSSWELRSPVLSDFEQRIAYHTQIEGIEAALTYTFYQNHLGQAKYVFEPKHEDAVEFVNNFHTVESWISQSYGDPTSVQEIWLDTLYQYDKSLWGQAVKRGHLVMVAEWNNPGTDITLVLDGGNDEVGLVADFTSTTFAVPVSLDTESQEEHAETVIEETTIQEAIPSESINPMVEDVSEQDITHEIGGSGEFHHENEVASHGPSEEIKEIEELEEIEHMLNEEYPLNESMEPAQGNGSMDKNIDETIGEETAIEEDSGVRASVNSEVISPEFIDKPRMNEQHRMNEGTSQAHPIEPSVDVQTQESAMNGKKDMPLEPTNKKPDSEAHFTDEHAHDHPMEAETELEHQHL